jgi:long-subunit fatty acid transport protein
VRAGVRGFLGERLGVELAFVWEQWSRYQRIVLEPQIQIDATALALGVFPVPKVTLNRNYQDAYSVRLGVDALLLRWLRARAGVYYETSAVRPEWFDISSPDSDKIGLGVGLSFKVRGLWLDAAYSHIFNSTVTTSASLVTLTNVAPGGPTAVVGNGTYRFSFDTFLIGIRGSFEPVRR